MKSYYLYIVTNKRNGTLYVGITNNIERRIHEHRAKCIEGFTSKYSLTELVYLETHHDIAHCIQREKQIKRWRRSWKVELIEENNPNWKDIYFVESIGD